MKMFTKSIATKLIVEKQIVSHRFVHAIALGCISLLLMAQSSLSQPLTITPAQGTIQTIIIPFEGVNRAVSLYVPTTYHAGTPVPLLFALHGGSGDASKMYDPDTRIVEYAESRGFIAVFPNGLPKPGAPAASTNYYWGDPVNVSFMDHLIDLLMANYSINERRIYFIGFSGGAKLAYSLAADPKVSARLAAIATMAGEMGGKQIAEPVTGWEVIDPMDAGGTPMSALLLQGGEDVRMPENGGFDDDYERIVTSFQMKVDVWRLFIGAGRNGSSISFPEAPARVQMMRYANPATGHTVVSAIDPVLAHRWPEWNFMGVIWDFFEQVSTASTCPTIILSPASLPSGTLGSSYSQMIAASPAGGNYTYAVSSGALPGGLTLSANGLLSGTPTANGTFNFTVRATSSSGCTGSRSYSVRIRNN
jgi:poly(3-hydroxybutyrate) depolymerase